MSRKLKNKKVEQILTEDTFLDQINEGAKASDLSDDKKEGYWAIQLYQAITGFRSNLSISEKTKLKSSIIHSIRKQKQRKIYYAVSSVAAILLITIVTLVFLFNRNQQSSISKFAVNQEKVEPSVNTRLILSDQEIEIETKDSKITYDKKGAKVTIGKDSLLEQTALENQIIYNTLIVPYGKRSQVTLADNSIIWLNSGSKLIYPVSFSNEKREVFLEGEAFFDIAHNPNHPFYVVSRDVEVKVLGTRFNVCAYSDDVTTQTVLEKGSVELKFKASTILDRSRITISPGTMAEYDPISNEMNEKNVNTKLYTSWKDGIIICQKEPLESIVKKVARYYNIKITIANTGIVSETFSGYLDLKNSADEVLQVINETLKIEIEEKNNEIIIR